MVYGNGTELDYGVTFDIRESLVVVEVVGGEVLPFTVVYLEAPFGGCITTIFCAVKL